jgi:hypothetical protein
MKKITSLGLCALMAPAITLGVSAALAQPPGADPQGAQPQQRESAERAQQAQQRGVSDAQSQRVTRSEPIVSKPAGSMLAEDVIGSALMSRQQQNFGPINDLILSEDGQVLAVIVGVGGFLGVGQRDVAIAWDSLERSVDDDGDTVFHVDMTDEALREAPAYRND